MACPILAAIVLRLKGSSGWPCVLALVTLAVGCRVADFELPVPALALGPRHACADLVGAGLVCWGENSYGQLAVGLHGAGPYKRMQLGTPTPVFKADGRLAVTKVAAGADTTCAIDADGQLWCWGGKIIDRCATVTGFLSSIPQTVDLRDLSTHQKEIAVGRAHACVIGHQDQVVCWGYENQGQLGSGQTGPDIVRNCPAPPAEPAPPPHEPVLVQFQPSGVASKISARVDHTCAIVDGAVHCWGANQDGQCGVDPAMPMPMPMVLSPMRVAISDLAADDRLIEVGTGNSHTCVLSENGRVWCWGKNDNSQLGVDVSVTPSTHLPHEVRFPVPQRHIAVGGSFGCAVGEDRQVRCWGAGDQGQLGVPAGSASSTPTVVDVPGGASRVEAGDRFACAVGASDAGLHCWGANDQRQVADPADGALLLAPTPVDVDPSHHCLERADQIVVRYASICARVDDRVYCWGNNSSGDIGTISWGGDVAPWSIAVVAPDLMAVNPELPPPLDQVGEMLPGHNSCVRRSGPMGEPEIWCWGPVAEQQLFGLTVEMTSDVFSRPKKVPAAGLTVATSRWTGCLLQADHRVHCWGRSDYGQAGEISPDVNLVDFEVYTDLFLPLSAVTQLAVGIEHACARTEGGEIWCWGRNEKGELAPEPPAGESLPRAVNAGITGAQLVAVGLRHETCAVAGPNREVECWGRSDSNIRGCDGNRCHVQDILGNPITDVVEIGVGDSFACARRSDGSVWCWGDNDYGQVGDGTIASRDRAVQVTGLVATSLSVGPYQVCVLEADGVARCWGRNQTDSGRTTSLVALPIVPFVATPTVPVPFCSSGAF